MSGADLLAAYKYQPNLEKRHAQLKGTQLVAPVFLHDPARIEALSCCHFIAMLIHALIERQIRRAMKAKGIKQLSLYPEDRSCAAPTAARVLDIFTGLAHHDLLDQHGQLVQTFPPELTELQQLVLDLLDTPQRTYTDRPVLRGEPKPVREVRKVSYYILLAGTAGDFCSSPNGSYSNYATAWP